MILKPNKSLQSSIILLVSCLAFFGCTVSNTQESPHFTIGLVTNNSNGMRNVAGFQDGMADLGYKEGENVTYLFAGEPVSGEALDSALQEMVEQEVDLIFTAGTPTGVAAHRITADTGIPVIFGVVADPIAAGVMEDITYPGGNMTGVRLSPSQDRRLELFLEIAPGMHRILVPYNPDDSASASAVDQIVELAPGLGVDLVLAEARTDLGVVELLANLPANLDAIFLVPDSIVNARLADIIALANDLKLPVSGPSTAQVEEGALTTYGFIHHAVGVQAARIADQVLRGANPGELPVETAESYLAVNLVVADRIGLEISDEFLRQAEFIIRDDETE
jgi:putative ABC transport system substrate-binding protein